jgi:DNA-binding response OmpR family regulator
MVGDGSGTIMIVEDDAVIALDLRQELEAHRFRVTKVVARSEEVVLAAQEDHPDLVIMDIRLDGPLDGVTLAEEIFVCEDTPVVFLSAYSSDEIRARARHSGAYGYLVKPVTTGSLVSTIDMALQKHVELRRGRGDVERLRHAMDVLESGVVIVDAGDRVVFMNRVAVGLTDWELWHTLKAPPPWVAALRSAQSSADAQGRFSATIRDRGGHPRTVRARACPRGGRETIFFLQQAG